MISVEPASDRSAAAYAFDHRHSRPPRELAGLLGGKGAGLAEMTSVLGLPVPPGFTLTVDVCRAYLREGWPAGLDDTVRSHCERLEANVGRRLGDPADPLLLAVRSGAPKSMPGMLDTVLNLGLNDETVEGLAAVSGDPQFAWDSYRRFLRMFATTVLGVPAEQLGAATDGADPRAEVVVLKKRIAAAAGQEVPADPAEQLRAAIEAVFRSWRSPRARAYRKHENVPDDLGTAVNVQAMVFGNRDQDSGTGVVFTRDPSTGHEGLYGDYLPKAQGEDVVAGTARTLPVSALADQLPGVAAELRGHLRTLERHYRDLCDVEFTVESGRLWVLQTRVGKRGAVAAVRTAVALTRDPEIALTPREAVARVPAETRAKARAEVLAAANLGNAGNGSAVTVGLGASPGRVSGAAVLDLDAAMTAEGEFVLVRPETSPEDVAAMSVAAGILTGRGGLVSHAAVVARGWGIPAVVGAEALRFADGAVTVGENGPVIRPGDEITVDGTTGEVWLGRVGAGETRADDDDATLAAELPELAVLEAWAADSGAGAQS
ncbi:pyruvate, phosphate dikinase [Amycolatopsis orientalis]|uniref:pyruvate, phosphate dikinase n=1 Tax=Amycolatopsis orientalis TaxID=31958 RepID=UPI0006889B78|nr:pyruvate, phosphate dikinase [Amycolatopsis orientalis]